VKRGEREVRRGDEENSFIPEEWDRGRGEGIARKRNERGRQERVKRRVEDKSDRKAEKEGEGG